MIDLLGENKPPTKNRGWLWWVIGGLSVLLIVSALLIWVADNRDEEAPVEAQLRAEAQAYQNTPEGKKEKEAAQAEQSRQGKDCAVMAYAWGKDLRNAGYDVQVTTSGTEVTVSGSEVNRAFAQKILANSETIDGLRQLHCTRLKFWNENAFSDVFLQAYDLNPVINRVE